MNRFLSTYKFIKLPRMTHESTARLIDHHTYYEIKIPLLRGIDFERYKVSHTIYDQTLSIRFDMVPESSKKSVTDIETPDGWITKQIL